VPEFFWLASKTGDPSDPANWYPDQVPQAGDLVHMYGNAMLLTGPLLNATRFHIGSDGTPLTITQTDPVLELGGGIDLNLTVEGPSDKGSHVRIDASGSNTLNNLIADGPSPNPEDSGPSGPVTKASVELNIADDSVLTVNHLSAFAMKLNINAEGPHSTLDQEGTSRLIYENQDVVHITPEIIGTGTFNMTFANLEVGNFVAPTQTFALYGGDSLIVDHPDLFKGTVDFCWPWLNPDSQGCPSRRGREASR